MSYLKFGTSERWFGGGGQEDIGGPPLAESRFPVSDESSFSFLVAPISGIRFVVALPLPLDLGPNVQSARNICMSTTF